MRIFLKNNANIVKQVSYPADDLIKPNITWRKKDENGQRAFSFTGDIEFVGEDYNFIKAELWDAIDALEREVLMTFDDDCCGGNPFRFAFVITAQSISWCEGSCTVTVAAVEKSAESEAIKCLENTLISEDDNGTFNDSAFSSNQPGVPFTLKRHPRMTYCNEIRPQWQHDFIIIVAIVFESTSVTFWPIIIMLIASIIPVINTINFINNTFGANINIGGLNIQGVNNDSTTFQGWIDLYKAQKDKLLDWMVGCGKKHPSPLVRAYAENVCAKCGLRFQSTIFQTPASDYFNTVYHFAPVDKGVPINDTSTFWIPQNDPAKSGTQFFDDLKTMFNGDWKVVNGTVIFERRDDVVFPWTAKAIPGTPWLDLTILDSDQYSICYSWSKKQRPSYGKFQYRRDAINTVGAEAYHRWADIVEWNNPVLPGQKGEFTPNIPFASCRFRDDHVIMNDGPERDVLSTYENSALVPAAVRSRIKKYKDCIILNQHLCAEPMLLIWDGVSNIADARVSGSQWAQTSTADANAGEFYNYPFWFDQTRNDNMYKRFWEIENPRMRNFQAKAFEAEIELTCLQLLNMDLDGLVKTNEGTGFVTEIFINYKSNTMTIKGEI